MRCNLFRAIGILLTAMLASPVGSWAGLFAPHPDGSPLRIVYSGTSITCGTGTSSYEKAFPRLVTADIEQLSGLEAIEMNMCFGGSISLAQLTSLKHEILPVKPDLLIMEVGTLDELYDAKLGEAAIAAMFQLAASAQIPTVAFYPITSYAALPGEAVLSLAREHGIQLLGIEQQAKKRGLSIEALTTDRVHANDKGHALIREVLTEFLTRRHTEGSSLLIQTPLPPQSDDALEAVRFVPASDLLPQFGPVPLVRFSALGSGISCEAGCTGSFTTTARLLVIMLTRSDTPISFSYKIDNGEWASVEQPGWLITFPLLSENRSGTHRIELKLANNVAGFLVL